MKEFRYVITDEVGIHARPAGMLVQEAKAFASKITISAGEKSAEATKLMALMGLGIKKGMEVRVSADGADEEQAIKQLEEFFRNHL